MVQHPYNSTSTVAKSATKVMGRCLTGGADILKYKRRRVGNKRSMVGKGREDEGKRTTNTSQLNTKESTRSHSAHVLTLIH